MHIHWRRPVTEVYGPYTLTSTGTWGRRRYRCRCGREWERKERQPPQPIWWEVTGQPPPGEIRWSTPPIAPPR